MYPQCTPPSVESSLVFIEHPGPFKHRVPKDPDVVPGGPAMGPGGPSPGTGHGSTLDVAGSYALTGGTS